jgi:hypothetical protein
MLQGATLANCHKSRTLRQSSAGMLVGHLEANHVVHSPVRINQAKASTNDLVVVSGGRRGQLFIEIARNTKGVLAEIRSQHKVGLELFIHISRKHIAIAKSGRKVFAVIPVPVTRHGALVLVELRMVHIPFVFVTHWGLSAVRFRLRRRRTAAVRCEQGCSASYQ